MRLLQEGNCHFSLLYHLLIPLVKKNKLIKIFHILMLILMSFWASRSHVVFFCGMADTVLKHHRETLTCHRRVHASAVHSANGLGLVHS